MLNTKYLKLNNISPDQGNAQDYPGKTRRTIWYTKNQPYVGCIMANTLPEYCLSSLLHHLLNALSNIATRVLGSFLVFSYIELVSAFCMLYRAPIDFILSRNAIVFPFQYFPLFLEITSSSVWGNFGLNSLNNSWLCMNDYWESPGLHRGAILEPHRDYLGVFLFLHFLKKSKEH